MRLPLLQPGAGLADADAALVARPQQLRRAVGRRRQVVAGGEGDDGEAPAQRHQGAQRPPGPRPLVRRMVYSELWAKRAMTKMVPISTAIGISSYRWLGTISVTYSSACVRR
jgi:hypothetical protein